MKNEDKEKLFQELLCNKLDNMLNDNEFNGGNSSAKVRIWEEIVRQTL